MDQQDIQTRLEELAFRKSQPFCYSCYRTAPTGRCVSCGSDDLMRERAGEGVEYGTAWVIRSVIRENLTAIDTDEVFEQSIKDCYPETTQVG